jgi:integrase/recombinase XerD
MTFEDYLNRYHTRETVKSYCYLINAFLLRYPKAIKLSYDDITQYIKESSAKKNMSTHLAAIKRYYDYLIETGKRDDHPCRNIKLHKKRRSIQIQDFFTPEELEKLLDRENRYSNLMYRNKVVVSLMIYQALSPSELCRLNCDDIDLASGTVHIKGNWRNAARTLDLVPKQILLIQNYMTQNRKQIVGSSTNKFLITIRGVGESTNSIHSIIEPLKHLYPERTLNPSTIRQSVIANRLNILRQSLEDVQLFAGHKWPSSTEQYKRKDITEQLEKINLWHPMG